MSSSRRKTEPRCLAGYGGEQNHVVVAAAATRMSGLLNLLSEAEPCAEAREAPATRSRACCTPFVFYFGGWRRGELCGLEWAGSSRSEPAA